MNIDIKLTTLKALHWLLMAAMTILGDRSLIKMISLQRRRCLVCVDCMLLIFIGEHGEDELMAALGFALSVSRPKTSPKLSLNFIHNCEVKETIKRNPSRFICLRRRARLFSVRSLALPLVCLQSSVLWQNYHSIGIFGLWSAVCVRKKMIGGALGSLFMRIVYMQIDALL